MFFLIFKIINFYRYLIARIEGFNFRIATSRDDLEKVYRLRWKVYHDEGYINSLQYQDKRLNDTYDFYSVNFLATHRGVAVGCVRLVLDSKIGFPIEHLFASISITAERRAVAEVSKLVIDSLYRKKKYGKRLVMWGLAKSMYDYSMMNGIKIWYEFMSEKLSHSLKKIGIEFKEIAIDELKSADLPDRNAMRGYFKKNCPKPYYVLLNKIPTYIFSSSLRK